MKKFLVAIALSLSVMAAYAQQAKKIDNTSLGIQAINSINLEDNFVLSSPGTVTLALGTTSLNEDVVAFTFTSIESVSDNSSLAKFQKLWEPQGDGTYTYYYKEKEEVYCGLGCGTIWAYTGRCKSTSGAVYNCSDGM